MLQFGATLLVLVAIGAVQDTLGSKYAYDTDEPCGPDTPCGAGQAYRPQKPIYKRLKPFHKAIYDASGFEPCAPGTPCGPVQSYRPSKRQYKRPPPSAKFSYKKPSSKDIPCVNNFVTTFIKLAESYEATHDLFHCFNDVSGLEFCDGKYPEFLDAFSSIRAPNPDFAAQQAVEEIPECFDRLDCDTVALVYANWIAKFLFTEGILNPKNAVHLAKKYVEALEEAASCNDSPYTALKEGFVNFLDSLGLFNPDKVLLLALQYRNEWDLASKF